MYSSYFFFIFISLCIDILSESDISLEFLSNVLN